MMHIYVSNLGERITDESLGAIFSTHGRVSSAKVAFDGFTGHSRGFAFVEMPDEDEAAAAISRINGSVIDGRAISACAAPPQHQQRGSYPVRRR